MSLKKVDNVVERLVKKMEMSQTPVPGYIVGLSGTDSLIAFDVCYEAMLEYNGPFRMLGVHHVSEGSSQFAKHTIPWMRDRYSKAKISVVTLEKNTDPLRWADLHELAISSNYWTVGSINATEYKLGKYTLLHKSVSVLPIRSIWKSEIVKACEELEAPQELLDDARSEDLVCGRDKFSASNIELIDDCLRSDPRIFVNYTQDQIIQAFSYIKSTMNANAWRERVPYIP